MNDTVKKTRRPRPKGISSHLKGIPRTEWPNARRDRGLEPLTQAEMDALKGRQHDVSRAPIHNVDAAASQQSQDPIPEWSGPIALTNVLPTPPKPAQARDPLPPPPNLFASGIRKLAVFGLDGTETDPLPGYRLYWMKDEGPRLQQAQRSGWAFVGRDEVMVGEGINNDVGSHIRTNASNADKVYLYLMKKPLSIEEQHQRQYVERTIMPIKEALKRGQMSGNPADMQYVKRDVHRVDDTARSYREGTS